MAKDRGVNFEGNEKAPQSDIGKNYIFIIGIDKYQNVTPLENAVNDARDFKDILISKYQFKDDHVWSLFDEDATYKNIKDKFREIAEEVDEEDNLIVFYSGHGIFDKVLDQGYWLPVDAETDSNSNYISNSDLAVYLKAIKTFHTFLISDSCFSGTLFSRNRDFTEKVESLPSRWGLASGRNEPVSDGSGGQNSPFTENLLYFLDNSEEESLPASRLVQYVKEAVANNSEQTPLGSPLQNVGDKGGEFVFHRKGIKLDSKVLEKKKEVIEAPEEKKTFDPEPESLPKKKQAEKTDTETKTREPESNGFLAKNKILVASGVGALIAIITIGILWWAGIIFTPEESVFTAVEQEGLWGYQNAAGEWVIEPKFEHAAPFIGDSAAVRMGEWNWLIDNYGFCIGKCENEKAYLASISESVADSVNLEIGSRFQGGVIIYLDSTGKHGLITSLEDQSDSISWGNGKNAVTNAVDTTFLSGFRNMKRIIQEQGRGDYAALLCHNLVSAGYDDWILPSKWELDQLYRNADKIQTLNPDQKYWSSSEVDKKNAWAQDLTTGEMFVADKDDTYHIRAIRRF